MSLLTRFRRPDTTFVVDWALTTCFLIGCCAHRLCPDPRPVQCAWRGGSIESGPGGKQNKQQNLSWPVPVHLSPNTVYTHTAVFAFQQGPLLRELGEGGGGGGGGGGRAREVMWWWWGGGGWRCFCGLCILIFCAEYGCSVIWVVFVSTSRFSSLSPARRLFC